MSNETRTVLAIFKANTAQYERSIKSLEGKIEHLEKAQTSQAAKAGQGFDSQAVKLAKLAGGFLAAKASLGLLTSGIEEFQKNAQLEKSLEGSNLKMSQLQEASRGLISEFKLMSFAAATLNTDFKLNQQQMNEVAKFMIVLRNQGNDLSAVYTDVTKALVEGNAEGLKKFGIVIKAQAGTLAGHHAIMKRIAEENAKAGDNILIAGDKTKQAQVAMANTFRDVKLIIGSVAESFAPLLQVLTESLGLIIDVGKALRDLADMGGLNTSVLETKGVRDYFKNKGIDISQPNKGNGSLQDAALDYFLRKGNTLQDIAKGNDDIAAQARKRLGPEATATGNATLAIEKLKNTGIAFGKAAYGEWEKALKDSSAKGKSRSSKGKISSGQENPLSGLIDLFSGTGSALGSAAQSLYDDPRTQQQKLQDYLNEKLGHNPNQIADDAASAKRSQQVYAQVNQDVSGLMPEIQAGLEFNQGQYLESIFGPVSEFDLYAEAFGLLEGAATSAFDAWITGSKSVSEAIAEFMAGALRSMALELFSNAIKHTAYGFGMLAFGRGDAAAGHFKAAAQFGAGAAVVGGLAKGMHGGGGGGAVRGGTSAAPPGGYTSTRDRDNDSSERVVYLQDFWDKNPAQKAYEIEKQLAFRRRYSGSGSDTVRFE